MIRIILRKFNLKKKRIIKYFTFIFCLVIILNYYFLQDYIYYDDLIRNIHSKKLKAVQLITPRFGNPNWHFMQLGQHPFEDCPESRCYAFRSKNHFHIAQEKSDGIIVHSKELMYMPSKNYNRSPKQLWLFYTLEPQKLSFCSNYYRLSDFDDWFNLTATFKTDSDIPLSYRDFSQWTDMINDKLYVEKYEGLSRHKNLTSFALDLGIKKSNNVTIAWFVSHCYTSSRREHYVKELSKYIKIDVFGKCSNGKNKDPCFRMESSDCQTFLNRYKFRLAFENSLCDDYISEKFWNIYSHQNLFDINLINIVRGAKDDQYQKVIPYKKFYINAEWFESPKKLAEYLIYLNNNDSAYLEYFKWKIDLYKKIEHKTKGKRILNSKQEKRFQNEQFIVKEPFCKLCQYLHNETYLNNHEKNRRWDISKWFGYESNCWDNNSDLFFLEKIAKFFGICIFI